MRVKEIIVLMSTLYGSMVSIIGQYDVFIKDTLIIEGDSVILFSDESWQFIRNIPNINEFLPPKRDFKNIDTNWLFSFNWENNRTHRNVINMSGLSDTMEIDLFPYDREVSLPILEGKLSSKFDFRWGQMHKGVDVSVKIGVPIFAVFSGKIRYAKFNSGGYGNLIIIRHYNGIETYYAHLNSMNVKPNDYVRAGQIIGYSGNTGHSTGPHLHFETRFIENAFNPEIIFNFVIMSCEKIKFTIRKTMFDYQKKRSTSAVDINSIVPTSGEEIKEKQPVIDDKKKRTKTGFYGDM